MHSWSLFLPYDHSPRDYPTKEKNNNRHFRYIFRSLCRLAVAFHVTTCTKFPIQMGQIVHQHQASSLLMSKQNPC